ncbi:MAG: serine/threonine protein kinase [Akkermansiaceae bacterium]|nr:serine/threonine protein kinase [Akkermansiaceae bacterium]
MTDRYEIIKLISKDPAGGMYLAQDTTLERKVVFRHIDADHNDDRPRSWAKEFATFSGKLCALQHPNLLTIYDVSVDDDGVSIVTQYVEGQSLAERLEQGPLKQMGAYRMASDLLEGLHAAHESGVYHGALHTGSVKRLPKATGGHRYLLVDLGLNTLATMVKGEDIHIADPVLLAPELHDDESSPDVAADLFMLGQLCYTALAGGHPFAGQSPAECARAHLAGELPPLSEFAPDIQPDFEAWVMHLSAGDRSQRPGSIKEAMESLQKIAIDEPEPNVPGKTHAVETTLPTPSMRTTAQVVVADADVPVLQRAGQGKKQPKKTIIVIASLCALILLGLLLVVFKNPAKDSAVPSVADGVLPAVPAGVKVHLHEVGLVNTMANRKNPVTVALDTEKTLDWIVATGAPAATNRKEKEAGHYIQSIFAVGNFKEFAMKDVPVKFASGEIELIPKAATDTLKGHKAKPGDGWEVILRIPPKHKGPVVVTLYMTQRKNDFDIAVAMPDGKEVIKFSVPQQAPGVVQIPLEITAPKAGGFYSFKILAVASGPKEGFTIGFNAVHVESR